MDAPRPPRVGPASADDRAPRLILERATRPLEDARRDAQRPEAEARYARLYGDVARRLRKVCADMAPEAFDRLVCDICDVKVRYPDDNPLGRRATDR